MTKAFGVSQSKVKVFRRCHQAYEYRYIQKIRKKGKSRPLQFGTMIHKALEYYFNGDDPQEYFTELSQDVESMKLFAQERETFGDILNDTQDIVGAYIEYWKTDGMRPIRKKGSGAEHKFEIELFPDVIWEGKIDLLAKRSGLRWLGEHKTYTRRPNDDDRWRNLQSVTYFRANDILGWEPLDGCMWDYIKSKPPEIPGVLKDGSISSKKIDTLPTTLNRLMESPDFAMTGGDLPAKLFSDAEANCSDYFQRIYTPVNRSVADMVFEDFEASVRAMIEVEEKSPDRWCMNIDKHCSWCDYEALCRARLQGLDFDYVMERGYEDGNKSKKDDESGFIHKAVAPESKLLDPGNRSAARKKGG